MSTQYSIPTSPPPGKHPPTPSPAPTSSANAETDPENSSKIENTSPLAAHKSSISNNADLDTDVNADADSKAMPPPPPPSTSTTSTSQPKPRPVITTRQPSHASININPTTPFSPSLTQSTSQNTALQDHPSQIQSQSQLQSQSQEAEKQKGRQPFTPFFTLVNDLSAGEQSTHHPAQVHYIFADDDVNEVLTGALLRSMDTGDDGDEGEEDGAELDDNENEDATSSSSSATFRRDGTRIRSERSHAKQKQKSKVRDVEKGRKREFGREERVIIVDVNESGDAVMGVSSLSPSWQVLSAEIGKAPTWDKDGEENDARGEGTGGLMLRIEGVGLDCGEPVSSASGAGLGVGGKGKGKEREGDVAAGAGSGGASAMGEEEMQVLMEGFDRKMGMLRRIVQRGSRESLAEGIGPGEKS